MNDENIDEGRHEGISRGQLIKGMGLGAGVAALAPTLATAADAASAPNTKVNELYRIYLSEATDSKHCVFSALLLPNSQFQKSVVKARGLRHNLQKGFMIRTQNDLNPSDLAGGRGHQSDWRLSDADRAAIFKRLIHFSATLPGAKLMLAVYPSKKRRAGFQALLSHTNGRLHKANSFGVLISHSQSAPSFLALMHGIHLFNPVSSTFDPWRASGKQKHAILLDRIVGHPRLRSGRHIQFVELSSFIAYAELRHVSPNALVNRLEIEDAITKVKPILLEVVHPG